MFDDIDRVARRGSATRPDRWSSEMMLQDTTRRRVVSLDPILFAILSGPPAAVARGRPGPNALNALNARQLLYSSILNNSASRDAIICK